MNCVDPGDSIMQGLVYACEDMTNFNTFISECHVHVCNLYNVALSLLTNQQPHKIGWAV